MMTAKIDQQSTPRTEQLSERRPGPPIFGRSRITPHDVAQLAESGGKLEIAEEVKALLASARAVVDSILARDEPAYGLTRGLGPLRDQHIPDGLQYEFQRFVFATHDAAVGPVLSRVEARSIMIARIAVMARGNSGATQALFSGLCDLVENDIVPALPGEGSVGSADLSLLAAVGLVLIGEGRVLEGDLGDSIPAGPVLAAAGLEPIHLSAKDAHALVAANAGSVGLGCLATLRLERIASSADLAAAATSEALHANVNVFYAELMSARPHPGQLLAAERMRHLFDGGEMADGELFPRSLQDPLSIRTIPQVHGTLLENITLLKEVLTIELNSMPENPYIDRLTGRMVSNGNFSSIRLAMAVEGSRLILAHTAMLSERRVSMMVGQLRSGRSLKEQVTTYADGLVPSILANTASALVARIQHLANPISMLGTGVGDGMEDHNAQAYSVVRLLQQSLDLTERLLAIEIMVATGLGAMPPHGPKHRRGPVLSELHTRALKIIQKSESGSTTNHKLDELSALLIEMAGSPLTSLVSSGTSEARTT